MNKSNILNIITSNSLLCSGFFKLWNITSTRSAIKIIQEMQTDDSIASTDNLVSLRSDIEKGAKWRLGDINLANSYNYGIKHAVFPYSSSNIYRPSIEHGMIFYDDIFEDVRHTAPQTCATMGLYRKATIHKYSPKPVFVVGPYIQYAEQFYSTTKLKEEKTRLGKTLLVFPSHSTNMSSITTSIKPYLKTVCSYAKQFDSVLVCSFWWNLSDPLIHALKAEGYRIVSAGFRDDPSFIKRLKTIITLSDLAIGDSIGTHIGYCFSENVPFKLIPSFTKCETLDKAEQKGESDRQVRVHQLSTILSSGSQNDIQNTIQYYWGANIYRTTEERKAMCDINRDIIRLTKGSRDKIYSSVHTLLKSYNQNDKKVHYKLLSEAQNNTGEPT